MREGAVRHGEHLVEAIVDGLRRRLRLAVDRDRAREVALPAPLQAEERLRLHDDTGEPPGLRDANGLAELGLGLIELGLHLVDGADDEEGAGQQPVVADLARDGRGLLDIRLERGDVLP